MKKAQTAVEVISILAVVLVLAVMYLTINSQLQSFTSESSTEQNILFESYDVGISRVEIGSVSTLTITNNLPYTIVLKNIVGTIRQTEYELYSGSLIMNPFDKLTITPDMSSLDCRAGDEYELLFEIIYTSEVSSNNVTLSPEDAYIFVCN